MMILLQMNEGFCRPSVIAVLLVLISFATGAAQTSKGPVDVKIDLVMAADTNQGCDKQLGWLKHRLIGLFHFSTYYLVRHYESHIRFGETVTFNLPSGRILHIEPKGIDGEMIKVEVMIFQGEGPMMTTDLVIMNHGIFMVGGPRYERGTLILIISIGTGTRTSTEVNVPRSSRAQHRR